MPELEGKVVVITGATSGIGLVAAESLAFEGARIIQIARDRARGQAAVNRLRALTPGIDHSIYFADLSSIEATRRVASEIAAAEARIHVLINNAGAIYRTRQITNEGLERTFALNHMSYFVLTNGLLDSLKASSSARVVNTSSDAHLAGVLDFDDLQSEKAYRSNFFQLLRYGGSAFKVYGTSKLCNILFTRALAKRLEGTRVTTNCFHPGFVATRFADAAGGLITFSVKIAKRFARTPEKGAETLIYLASAAEVAGTTGEYFHDCHPASTSAAARNDETAERLWEESSKLAGRSS